MLQSIVDVTARRDGHLKTARKANQMPKSPTPEQMRLAAEWLDCNEAHDGTEQADCLAVRDWLRAKADQAEARIIARDYDISVSQVRHLMSSKISRG
jgi:hypothetical protein